MIYGINLFNINENYRCLCLIRQERIYFGDSSTNYTATIQVNVNEICVIKESSDYLFLLNTTKERFTFKSTQGAWADCLIFSTVFPSQASNYGVNVFNAQGQLVFSSNHKQLEIVQNIYENINFPSGRKYGVIAQHSLCGAYGNVYAVVFYYSMFKVTNSQILIKQNQPAVMQGQISSLLNSSSGSLENLLPGRKGPFLIADITGI